jgi:L-arabinose isomerase
LRVGLFGIGLDAYWPQFAGLKERLEGYVGVVGRRLARLGVEVVNLGLVDSPDRAHAAGREFRRADVDLLFLYATTYALSSTVLPVVQRARVPVIVLNLAPRPAIDYAAFNRLKERTEMTGQWLAFCSACPVPEIGNVFKRAGIRWR